MSLFDAALYRLRNLVRPDAADRERDEEFAFHQSLAEANQAHPIGNATYVKETMRWMGATRWIDQLAQDLRLAKRGLQRAPLFTIIVVFTLSLGIGANATVLGVIDTMMFRKLPVPEPEQIVTVDKTDRRDLARHAPAMGWSTAPLYRDLRANVRGVESLGAYGMQTLNVAGEWTWSAFVSGNYFDVLGVKPQRGRFIQADEEEIGAFHSVIVISDYLWRTRFKADESILGRKIPIGIEEFTVVGVAPPGFTGLHPEGRTNVWMPYTMANVAMGKSSGMEDREGRPMMVFGRLRDGATISEVEGSANAFAHTLALANPNDSTLAFRVLVRDRLTSIELSTNAFVWLTFIWVVIALLHLVACSNVASLMLARAAARRRDLGVRLCLGASRRRILVQSLTEATLLATLGAAGGLVVARWLTTLITSMQFMSAADGGFDGRIVAIVSIVTAATVLQFGLLPAIDASRSDPMAVLRGFDAGGRGRHSRAEIVVVVQVAISMMLIINSAVFLGLLRRQVTAQPGFDADHMLVASVAIAKASSVEVDQAAAMNEVLTRVRSLPGVRAATASTGSPLLHVGFSSDIVVPGRAPVPNEQRKFGIDAVAPGYFAAIGAPLARGREFTSDDRAAAGQRRRNLVDVVIINETLARRLWPNEDALGKQLRMDKSAVPSTVVGIARDMRDVSMNGAVPRAYLPLRQWIYTSFDVLIRVDGDPASAVPNIAAALDTSVVSTRPTIRTMPSIVHDATQVSRVGSSALAICAGVALLLTSVGLYGLVAMWTLRRRNEIGIRLALGATRSQVHRVLLSGAGKIIATGGIMGLVLAIGLVKIEQGWMGPIVSLSPLGVVGSLATFAAIGGLAVMLPSLRATRQPPAEVLRS
jgi:predicted permease